MNVYTLTGFTGHWPVGTAVIVTARDKGHARRLVNTALKTRGLPTLDSDDIFTKLDLSVAQAIVLNDGEY